MGLKGKLIRIDDGGVDEDGRKQEIVIDGVTHLGRASKGNFRSDSPVPEIIIDEAELYVKIEEPTEDPSLSVDHAVIYPPSGDFVRKCQIKDLGSRNGTFLNGSRLRPGVTEFIPDGSSIELGESVRFKCETFDPEPNPNHALMIGHYGETPRIAKSQADELRTELLYKGYAENVTVLHDVSATRVKILNTLQTLAGKVTKNSDFIFYFAGHGNKKGELFFGNERLAVKELFDALKQFRGRIFMIMDGCYPDSLATPSDLPPHSAMIGHSTRSGVELSPTLLIDTKSPYEVATNGYITEAFVRAQRSKNILPDKLLDKLKEDPNIRIIEKKEPRRTTEIRLRSASDKKANGGIGPSATQDGPPLTAQSDQESIKNHKIRQRFIMILKNGGPAALDVYTNYKDMIDEYFKDNIKDLKDAAKQGFLKCLLIQDYLTAGKIYQEFLRRVDLSQEVTKAYIEFAERDNFSGASIIIEKFVSSGLVALNFNDPIKRNVIEEKYLRLKKDGKTDNANLLKKHLSKTGIDFDALDKESQADGEIPIQPREYVHQEVVINESEQAMDLFTKFLCERKFDVAATVYQKFGLNGKPGFEQALKNAVRMCLETDDPQDAALIKHDYGVGIDFFKEIEAGLIAVLDRNDKKHCRHYVACLPDESRQAYFNVLSNGLSYYAEILRKILTEQGVMVMPEAYQRAAYQGYLKNLERGDLSTANDFYDKFDVEKSKRSPEETKAAISKGFYQCLISGDFKNAKIFLRRVGNLIDTQKILLGAYNDCIHFYPDKLEIATQISLKFGKLADFPK